MVIDNNPACNINNAIAQWSIYIYKQYKEYWPNLNET